MKWITPSPFPVFNFSFEKRFISQKLDRIDKNNGEILLCTTLWSFWGIQISFGRRIPIEMEGGNKADGQENKKAMESR